MKNLLIATSFCLSLIFSFANAGEAKKDVAKNGDPKIKVPVVELKKDNSAAPCQLTQEQLLKQLEDKKKAESSIGSKTAGLQGLGTAGCSVK